MSRRFFFFFLCAWLPACSGPAETEPRVWVRYGAAPVSFGRLVQTVNAMRLLTARSDPMQAAFPAALAHAVSLWYGLAPFHEETQEEEAYLLSFCRAAGWQETSTPGCARRILQTILEQAADAVHVFSRVESLRTDVDNLALELEALSQEPAFSPPVVWEWGERRVKLETAQIRRLPPGLPVLVEGSRFRVAGSAEIPLTNPARIREILDHAAALDAPAALSLLSPVDAKTTEVLMVLGIARDAGIARVWAWGVHDNRSAAVELELVSERDPLAVAEPAEKNPDGADVSRFETWGDALGFLSRNPSKPVRISVPVFRAEPPQLPSLDDLRRKLVQPEP